jgi:hypothetical protein
MSKELLFAWFTAIGLMAVTTQHFIISRMRKHYPSLFIRLGSPELIQSNFKSAPWKLQRFIWWGHLSDVGDRALHALCFVSCLLQLIGLVMFVMLL